MTTTGRRSAPPTAIGLVARTVALRGLPDLLEVAGDDGLLWRAEDGGLAAHGTAIVVGAAAGAALGRLGGRA